MSNCLYIYIYMHTHTHICMYVFWHFPPSASSRDTQKLSRCSKRNWHPDLSISLGRFLSFLWEFYFCETLFFWALRSLESFAAAASWGPSCPPAEQKRQPWDSKRVGELAGGQDSPVKAVAFHSGGAQGYSRPSRSGRSLRLAEMESLGASMEAELSLRAQVWLRLHIELWRCSYQCWREALPVITVTEEGEVGPSFSL